MVGQWSVRTLGHPILDLQVDEITVTEVLRLLILSSGAHMKPSITSYRNQYRGGWSNEEDPLLQTLRHPRNVSLYAKLETDSVYTLPPEDRLQLLLILSDAVLR